MRRAKGEIEKPRLQERKLQLYSFQGVLERVGSLWNWCFHAEYNYIETAIEIRQLSKSSTVAFQNF